ncbi:MAG: glycosyltransferase family 2 protein [Lachnospiraceae bacterium]|nr:glycosyltransferase family 2 protein [Lachnospiraceae bacterium]
MDKVSFVIPCYRSETTLPHVIAEIRGTMEGMRDYSYEIVLVNDCSPDGTMRVIRELCETYDNIRGVCLARNFGQHAALMAGFRHVTGDIIICLDDDGQTPAAEAPKFLEQIRAGRDVVYAKYSNKQHTAFRNFGSKVNEIMTRFMLGKPKELYISSYFAAKRFVIDEVVRYENSYPYVIGLVLRTTKNIGNVDVVHRQRESGHSGYTMKALLGLWFNGFTAFSIQPLRFATLIGVFCAGAGFLYGIYTIVKRLLNPNVPIGFSSMMSALVFIGGMIMLMLGLIGEYVGRIYISLNNSPQYVIREVVGQPESAPGDAGN